MFLKDLRVKNYMYGNKNDFKIFINLLLPIYGFRKDVETALYSYFLFRTFR